MERFVILACKLSSHSIFVFTNMRIHLPLMCLIHTTPCFRPVDCLKHGADNKQGVLSMLINNTAATAKHEALPCAYKHKYYFQKPIYLKDLRFVVLRLGLALLK